RIIARKENVSAVHHAAVRAKLNNGDVDIGRLRDGVWLDGVAIVAGAEINDVFEMRIANGCEQRRFERRLSIKTGGRQNDYENNQEAFVVHSDSKPGPHDFVWT